MIQTVDQAVELLQDLFRGRFQLGDELGATSWSRVFRAKDLASGKAVLVKIVDASRRTSLFENFLLYQRQAKARERLSHRRIPPFVAAQRGQGGVVLVEGLVEGTPLSRLLRRTCVPPSCVLTLISQLSEALAPYHDAGFFHLNLTPSNIILAGLRPDADLIDPRDIDAHIVSFGHSVLGDSSSTGEEAAESCAYSAPERIGMLTQIPDGRADIYSMGVTAYRLLAGRLPYDGETTAAYLHRVMATRPLALKPWAPDVSPELENLIIEMTARRPEDRPKTTPEVLGKLQDLGVRDRESRDADSGKARASGAGLDLVERGSSSGG